MSLTDPVSDFLTRVRNAIKARQQKVDVPHSKLKVEMAHVCVRFFSGGKPLTSPMVLATGGSREVEMRFPPQAKTGVARDYILLKSNDPVRSTLSIYVSRYVISRKELQDLFDRYKSVLKDN